LLVATIPLLLLTPKPLLLLLLLLVTVPHAHLLLRLHAPTTVTLLHPLLPCLPICSCTP
jgi:hypothetical protein